MIEIDFIKAPAEYLGKRKINKNIINSGPLGEISLPGELEIELSVKKEGLKIKSNNSLEIKVNGKKSLLPCILAISDIVEFNNLKLKIINFSQTPANTYKKSLEELSLSLKNNPSLTRLIQKLSAKIDI